MKSSLNIFLLGFLLTGILFAQDEPKSNVELPDFVITGKDQITFPPAKKMKPDVISALSEEFINPPYKAEEFSAGEISTPETIVTFKKDSVAVYPGIFSISFGNLTIPEMTGSYTFRMGRFTLSPSLSLKNIREYEPNNGKNIYSFDLSSSYTTGAESGIFSGLIVDADAGFFSHSRKLYKDDTSFKNRNLNLYSVSAGARKMFSGGSGFSLSTEVASAAIKEFNAESAVTKLNLGGFISFSKVVIGADAELGSVSINDLSQGDYRIGPSFAIVTPGKFSLRVSGGAVKAGENNGIFIDGKGSFNLSEALSFGLTYKQGWQRADLMQNLAEIQFFVPDTSFSRYENHINHIRFETKYRFKHYFEASVFIKSGKTEQVNYFLRDTSDGVFRAGFADASVMSIGADVKFHEGPMGFLYGHVNLSSVKDDTDKFLPYVSSISGSLFYGRKINSSFDFITGAEYHSAPYTDRANLNKADSFFDLNLTLRYYLSFLGQGSFLTLRANNLLSADNSYWEGYPGRPADIRLGFELRF